MQLTPQTTQLIPISLPRIRLQDIVTPRHRSGQIHGMLERKLRSRAVNFEVLFDFLANVEFLVDGGDPT